MTEEKIISEMVSDVVFIRCESINLLVDTLASEIASIENEIKSEVGSIWSEFWSTFNNYLNAMKFVSGGDIERKIVNQFIGHPHVELLDGRVKIARDNLFDLFSLALKAHFIIELSEAKKGILSISDEIKLGEIKEKLAEVIRTLKLENIMRDVDEIIERPYEYLSSILSNYPWVALDKIDVNMGKDKITLYIYGYKGGVNRITSNNKRAWIELAVSPFSEYSQFNSSLLRMLFPSATMEEITGFTRAYNTLYSYTIGKEFLRMPLLFSIRVADNTIFFDDFAMMNFLTSGSYKNAKVDIRGMSNVFKILFEFARQFEQAEFSDIISSKARIDRSINKLDAIIEEIRIGNDFARAWFFDILFQVSELQIDIKTKYKRFLYEFRSISDVKDALLNYSWKELKALFKL